GVILCILSVVPLFICAFMETSDMPLIVSTDLIFIFVSVGVYIMVCLCTRKESIQQLLREGEFDPALKEENERNSKLGGIFWPVAAAVYLGWSFLTDDWHITWVVWPVAGLLYAAISAALKKSR
ncbi:MAG: XRE family transcriptional regulator, partial [Bacillota bacterium]|nr:XRE family transcriptional regulator [Bacillota bacterium]